MVGPLTSLRMGSFIKTLIPGLLSATLAQLVAGSAAIAYEVDNFTGRDELTSDSLPILDHEVNRILDRAARQANLDSPRHCNRVMLRREILRYVGPNPVSLLEIWATFTGDLEQVKVNHAGSIYAGASLKEAPAIWLAGIGRSLRLGGYVVGTDKIGHFFMQGYAYYKAVQDGKPLERVLTEDAREEGIWGMPMTGVKSYADMAANYQGYRFWSRLHARKNAYFECRKGEWRKVRDFSWAEYVNVAWDEAINCSEMDSGLQAKVERNLLKLGMSCPVEPGRCDEIRKLEMSQYFTSPKCRKGEQLSLKRELPVSDGSNGSGATTEAM